MEDKPKRFKTGGRTKGTPNVKTKEIKDLLTAFIHQEMENIEDTYYKAPPSERLKFLSSVIQFTIPKMREIETTLSTDSEGLQSIVFEFNS